MTVTSLSPSNSSAAPPAVHKRTDWLPVIMTAPATLALIGILYPFAIAVYYSFTNYRIVSKTYKVVGFQNYVRMFSNADFWEAMGNTLMFAAAALLFELALGFLIALLLNRSVPGVGLMRALLLLPLMVPPVISGMMWKTMLASSSGPVNYIFGLGNYAWFANPWSARFVVIFIEVWSSTPFVALVLLSGLQSLPKAPFEAAQVDGANAWFILNRLMLPMLKPFILIVLLFRVVDVIKLFDIVFATTSGGPMFTTTTIPILVYKEVFKSYTLGSATAKVLMLWVINYVISFWLASRWRKTAASIR
ncbi:MAG: sugar ABC transporter permease [Anaerolineales bacterium]|nr:sugar ABC transporter permease [Anaerolineales bacterium]